MSPTSTRASCGFSRTAIRIRLQGVGPDGCEFIIAFDDGRASEFSTLLVTDFLAHTPPDILAQNFRVPVDTFSRIPLWDRYIFQSNLPGPLAADRAAVLSPEGPPKDPFSFSLKGVKEGPFFRQGPGGTAQIADSRNFLANKYVAASLVTLVPGGLRELHWHPNADEWQYYIKGRAQVGVFTAGPKAQTQNFNPGDIGYVKRNNGHYVKNTGNTELQFLEVFRSPVFQDVSLSDWLTHTPPAMVAATFNIDPSVIAQWPKDKPETLPLYQGMTDSLAQATLTDRAILAAGEALAGRRHGLGSLLPFAGPAVMASVAYMDPGNFATNSQAGAKFNYNLLWVVVVANVIAMLFQALSAKLGIVTGRNLAELCREQFPRPMVLAMWVVSEVGAMATDLAEFLGGAIGLSLLFWACRCSSAW